jgi:hypothetical protein
MNTMTTAVQRRRWETLRTRHEFQESHAVSSVDMGMKNLLRPFALNLMTPYKIATGSHFNLGIHSRLFLYLNPRERSASGARGGLFLVRLQSIPIARNQLAPDKHIGKNQIEFDLGVAPQKVRFIAQCKVAWDEVLQVDMRPESCARLGEHFGGGLGKEFGGDTESLLERNGFRSAMQGVFLSVI